MPMKISGIGQRRWASARLSCPRSTARRVVAGKFSKSRRRGWSWYAGDWAITGSLARMHTMTKRQGKSGTIDIKAVLAEDEEFLRALVRTALQEVLEAEMTEAL